MFAPYLPFSRYSENCFACAALMLHCGVNVIPTFGHILPKSKHTPHGNLLEHGSVAGYDVVVVVSTISSTNNQRLYGNHRFDMPLCFSV